MGTATKFFLFFLTSYKNNEKSRAEQSRAVFIKQEATPHLLPLHLFPPSLLPTTTTTTMMHSMNTSSMESSFDYRSLLPTRSNEGASSAGLASADESSDDSGACWGWCALPCEMTWRERLLGCATCMVAGYILSFGSFFRIKDLLLGDPFPFVLNATIGNVIALAGSCFLSGPQSQLAKMWHESRRLATALYLGSLVLTLLVAFLPIPGRALLLILLMLCQYLSITWYCLSYIPFAREAISGYIQRRWGDAM